MIDNLVIIKTVIRELSQEDRDTLKKLTNVGEGKMMYSSMYDAIKDLEPGPIFIAYCQSEIVGWARVTTELNKEVHVYVSPKYRRNGIGSILLSNITGLYKTARLTSRPWNSGGFNFYYKNNFSLGKHQHYINTSDMQTKLTKAQALAAFKREVLPGVIAKYGPNDRPAKAEAWVNYVDSITRLRHVSYEQSAKWDNPFSK